MNQKDRVGEIGYNNFNSEMKIIKYIKSYDMFVEFQDEHKSVIHCTYPAFRHGSVKNPYDKSVYGIGYLGNTTSHADCKVKKSYDTWTTMLRRCYSVEYDKFGKVRFQSYANCSVCDEWHCYANFEIWYDENYYSIDGEEMALDKDILRKGNKTYSPNTCVFVPQRINGLFVKKIINKIHDVPCGVFYLFEKNKRRRRRITSRLQTIDKCYSLRYYETIEEAFESYKQAKEKYIKRVADDYKDKIPQKLYDAMYRWEVEITD